MARARFFRRLHGLATFLAFVGNAVALAQDAPADDPITLPAATHVVKIKPGLASAHPRLFFDKAGLEAIRAKMKDPRMAELRAQFIAGADKLITELPKVDPKQTEDPFRGYGDRLSITAMAYLITGDTRYLDNTKQWMAALDSYPTWAGDVDLGCGHCLFGMAMAYDWLYDQLTPDERQKTEAALLLHARHMVVRSTPAEPGKNWGWAFFQNHAWVDYNGITFAAMALYDVDHDEAQAWLNYTRDKFQPTATDLGVDGGNYEGPAYEHYGTQQLLMYVDALRFFSGEDLYGMPYFSHIGYFPLYSMMPDWKNVANFGDSGETGRGRVDDENPLKLAALQHDGHFLTYEQKAREAESPGEPITALSVIWADPSVAPKPLNDVPLIGLYPDLGLVTCRTSWADDAAVVAFHCGAPGGAHLMQNWASFPGANVAFSHTHTDAGSFLFWANHDWRIANPGAYTHAKVTHNENVWTASGLGQMGETKWFDAHGYLNKQEQAHLVTVATSAAADYLVGEAAPAYAPAAQVTSFRRHILFVKSATPYLVVYDYLKAAVSQNWTSYLHSNGAFTPAADGGGFQVAVPVTFGTFLAPGKLSLQTGPLTVVRHPDDKPEERGFELAASPASRSDSTWLVTVIGIEPKKVTLLGAIPAPAVQVDDDKIRWDAQDGVSFNGTAITGNLLTGAAGK